MTTADLGVFQTERRQLFSIAYRMLGSASEAEDVLQDAWMRYQRAGAAGIKSPIAYASTIVTRLCLDRLKSVRASREEYVGTWLPEPVLTSELASPETKAERLESVTLAFLLLLEQLSPEERAVFILREVFGYDHGEVAEIIDTSVENSRQLLHRAKAHLAHGRRTVSSVPERTRRETAEAFAHAFAEGDVDGLSRLLARDVEMVSDGGGKVPAIKRPIVGRDEVIALLAGIQRAGQRTGVMPTVSWQIADVNQEAAVVIHVGERLDSVFVLSLEGGEISAIRHHNDSHQHHLERPAQRPALHTVGHGASSWPTCHVFRV